jgi:divalent metal cation (Fe/Co/Zn/Cd) transporter
LEARITEVVEEVSGLCDCHKIRIRPGPDGYDVVLHCLADSDLPIEEAHRLARIAENRLHAELPSIGQVLIHIEPQWS